MDQIYRHFAEPQGYPFWMYAVHFLLHFVSWLVYAVIITWVVKAIISLIPSKPWQSAKKVRKEKVVVGVHCRLDQNPIAGHRDVYPMCGMVWGE